MSNLGLMRRLAMSWKAVAPGGGRQLAGKDFEGNLYFEKPDPNGGRYPRRTVELANPELSEANYDDANISVQWQAWLRNTRKDPPTLAEIQRDEARKLLTVARAKALDQAWQDRKAELALEQAQGRQAVLGLASSASKAGSAEETSTSAAAGSSSGEEDPAKSAARKQIEEREAARKAGFKPQVQQGDSFEPQAWSPVATRRPQVHQSRIGQAASSMDTQEQGSDLKGISGKGSDHPKPVASNPPSAQFTNGLLVASGTAFLTGIFGSLWYQGRQEKRKGINRAAAGTPVGPSLQSLNDLKMAESLLKEGRMLGVKAFAIATTMCISGAVLVVGGTRWALDVETIPEFSAKMRELFPKQKSKFVDAVVGADRSVFGEPTAATSSSSGTGIAGEGGGSEEKDLDHEEDVNILGRIERELKRLESEELSSMLSTSTAAPPIDK
ncbi:hypothetical protein BG015_002698 [Linnemannia schmuckeri]|uniref:Uncharacterized protein n=1 Tax=Linnemannia schmuckeri TaxID=64567 RepID=A0A9P5RNR7_9FUNG|nr:hypothetical protein BG015_002698 [Linnemannia schmuckeri]